MFTCSSSTRSQIHLLAKLQVFSEAALEAWYALHRTGKPEHYFAFIEAVKKQAA